MGSLFENTEQLLRCLESARAPLSERQLMENLQCSRATFHRALKALKDNGECIVDERGLGYRLEVNDEKEKCSRGFTFKELEALAVLWQMLENTQNEWVDQYGEMRSALLRRLRNMGIGLEKWEGRVHYLPQHRRRVKLGVFQKMSNALLHRKVIRFRYAKSNGSNEIREVHPQQLVLYRNGWNLDALDESRIGSRDVNDLGLRQFSLDLITEVREVKKNWREVNLDDLSRELASGYGLFAGKANSLARIQFWGSAAFYVRRETWHPKQVLEEQKDGSVILQIPFVMQNPQELIGDILRWGDEALVIGPIELKNAIKKKILAMANNVS